MKYVVINVYDREIVDVGVANTKEEAMEIMKEDFLYVFTEYCNIEDFENKVGFGDSWEITDNYAWLNARIEYDWKIIEVE